ncbi:hypothetical protein [Oribacterium sp. FC2011]|uniref:hypothetical protein n=1 Tax=Oribacterium sp. FC2011 TaxID=1408311 RepID=UPI0004E0E96E|nr:hypothetical protein [Oribacterium sp. FC2011]
MKKRIIYAAAAGTLACMMLVACSNKKIAETVSDQTSEAIETEAQGGAPSEESVKDSSESSEAPADAPEQKSDEKAASEMQSGEAVHYDGQILFRNYSSQAPGYGAMWGKFQRNSTVYVPGSLCTFDPKSPEKGITTVCEDSGNGCLYLKDGNILYSQKVTDYSAEGEQMSHVYKKELPDGEDKDICPGEIRGFSPDGGHFVVYTYTLDPYKVQYYIYETGDIDTDTAHYEPEDSALFLTMDDDNAYFLEKKEGNIHTIVQVSNNGNIYRLGECDFTELAEYGISYPEFSGDITTDNGKLEAQFDFYEGTGHFYYTSAKVSVPICQDTENEAGDSVLFDAEVEDIHFEEDPQSVYPDGIKDMMYDYPAPDSGKGVANVIQNYEELDEGIFFTKAQSHRDSFEDVGWREYYCLLNYYYYFLPKGEKDPVLLYTMFEPLGKKGTLDEYEYYETQPTLYAYAGFYEDKDGKLVGAYYEEIYTGGPETPTEVSNLYNMAEFSDEFYYEHLKDDYSLDDFVVSDLHEFTDYIHSWVPQNSIPVRPAQYDENGNLKFEPELSIKDGDSVYMCHLGFDKDGKIYYIRPVIMD